MSKQTEIAEIVEITEIEIEFVVQKLSNCLNPPPPIP